MKCTVLVVLLLLLQCGQALIYPAVRLAAFSAAAVCKRCSSKIRARRTRANKKAVGLALISTGGLVAVGASAVLRDRDFYTPSPGSLVGQAIVITGASSGLGLESAKRLAGAGASLVLTARTAAKGILAVATINAHLEAIRVSYGEQTVSYKVVDFDNLDAVKAVDWSDVDKIDVLVNNAGVMALPDRTLTKNRIEKQMQSNHVGPFLLTAMLADKLSDTARIVNLSSSAHQFAAVTGGLDFEFLWKAELGYSPWLWYGYSKLANLYFTQELQRRSDASSSKNWTVTAVHPGVVATNLGRYTFGSESSSLDRLGSLVASAVLKSPEEGASTQVWLAAGNGEGGKYYENRKEQTNIPTDASQARQLWHESERLIGMNFTLS
jgi:NAD(P)-dependent dehydrogenase (short-subunit alcohol dehydrogenase family)